MNLRLKGHPAFFQQQAAAVEAVKLVGRKAHGVHPVEDQLGLAHRLSGIHMKAAVGIALQNGRNIADGLHGAQLAVHSAHRQQHGVLPQKPLQMRKIHGSVRPDIHQLHLTALLLQGGQSAAHRGMLQRRDCWLHWRRRCK